MGCWASTPPFLVPSLPPGSDLTWECYSCEQVLSAGCLSHQGRGDNWGSEPRNILPRQGQLGAGAERGAGQKGAPAPGLLSHCPLLFL